MEKANLEDLKAFTTRDGSSIRELAGPAWTPARARAPAYSDDDTVMTGG